jgi:hypothetical protein
MKPVLTLLFIVMLASCDDSKTITPPTGGAAVKSTVSFENGREEIPENKLFASVKILYSKPAYSHGYMLISAEGEFIKHLSTSPPINNGFIRIPFQQGQTESYFDIIPLDDLTQSEDRVITLQIAETSSNVIRGNQHKLTLIIKEND